MEEAVRRVEIQLGEVRQFMASTKAFMDQEIRHQEENQNRHDKHQRSLEELKDMMRTILVMEGLHNPSEEHQDRVDPAPSTQEPGSNLGANSEEQNCEMVYSSTKESIADLVGDFGHSRFEVGGDARRPKTMEDKEIEFSTQRVSAKSFHGNREQQFQESSASINFGLSPNLRSGIDEIVESEPTAYLYQTPELPSFLMEEDMTRIESPQKNHQSSGSPGSSLDGNSTDLKVIHSSSLESMSFPIASEEMSEWIDANDASFDSIEIREADLKLNSMECLVTFLAHKVYAKMFEKQKADVDDYVETKGFAFPLHIESAIADFLEVLNTLGEAFGSVQSRSFPFDPGKHFELSLHTTSCAVCCGFFVEIVLQTGAG